jgi:transcription antitermination factor NusG
MTMQTRLQKVTQSLSPLQRIVLILRAQREGREPDPELYRDGDPQQRKAFNRYIALLYVINRELGALCYTVSGFSEFLDCNAEQVRLLERAAEQLEEAEGIEKATRPRDWRSAQQMEVPEFLRSMAAELRHDLLKSLAQRWSEVGAVEQTWQELAEEFGGEEPVTPELRAIAVATKGRLQSLAQEFGGKRRLGPPTDAALTETRRVVDEAFEKLRPLL